MAQLIISASMRAADVSSSDVILCFLDGFDNCNDDLNKTREDDSLPD